MKYGDQKVHCGRCYKVLTTESPSNIHVEAGILFCKSCHEEGERELAEATAKADQYRADVMYGRFFPPALPENFVRHDSLQPKDEVVAHQFELPFKKQYDPNRTSQDNPQFFSK